MTLRPLRLGLALAAGLMASLLPARAEAPPVLSMEAVLEDKAAPHVTPESYDVTIIMFSDYNCPYCRRAHPVVMQAIAEDPKVRLVYRDWPILGPASVEIARLAIASQFQGKHAAFHDALMKSSERLTADVAREIAAEAGLDVAKLDADLAANRAAIDALLDRTDQQAPALGLSGTPAFLIGTYLVPGMVDVSEMKKIIADARAEGAR